MSKTKDGYSPNGLFTGKSLTTPPYPRYIGFDSKCRLIKISYEFTIENL